VSAIDCVASEHGKPDMVRLALAAYAETGAEAVICISNKKLTWQVVHGLERRGIPAYGAIWDS
jgi:ketopantoate hydroxymethyltransferase